VRALLGDFVEHYKGVNPVLFPGSQLALGVWYQREPQNETQHLLMLFTGPPMSRVEIAQPGQPLLWKIGHEGPPFIEVHWTSVQHFEQLLAENPQSVAIYKDNCEVLYYQKDLLPEAILDAFRIRREPDGLIKGWYVATTEFPKTVIPGSLLQRYAQYKYQLGLVKTFESPDFDHCRGMIHEEYGQAWLPLSPEGLNVHTFYTDYLDNKPGYFLLEGGSIYRIEKFEVSRKPEYSSMVLQRLPDDRYPEVYLRAVR